MLPAPNGLTEDTFSGQMPDDIISTHKAYYIINTSALQVGVFLCTAIFRARSDAARMIA